jgi:hypothetical protein
MSEWAVSPVIGPIPIMTVTGAIDEQSANTPPRTWRCTSSSNMSLLGHERWLCNVLDRVQLGNLTLADVILIALWVFFGVIRRVTVILISVLTEHMWRSFSHRCPELMVAARQE